MRVKKRSGEYQPLNFNSISRRVSYLVDGIDPDGNIIGPKLDTIDPNDIARDGIAQIIDGISTSQIDEFMAELCAYKVGTHFEFGVLADRLAISNHHKNTQKHKDFSAIVDALYHNVDAQGKSAPLLAHDFYATVMKHKDRLDAVVNKNHIRDYESLDYFGFKTAQQSYLLTIKNGTEFIQERYQHLLMREALAMYLDDIDEAINCYELFSLSMMTHATPTLFNSGTLFAQLSSCFLAGMFDSIDGMYECIRRLSHISKWAGGIGLSLSKIRASGSSIRGTNGESTGIMPLMKVLNEFARHVNQGGKRKGSVAVYLEPWHADIFPFLDIRKNQGHEELRARDLFTGLFICNIFMRRVKRALLMKRVTGTHDIKWSLMCPDECPGLTECHSETFDQLYEKYENEGRYKKQIDILLLWQAIIDSQKETGTPYMLFKDTINHKSNQKNVGMITQSNLCSEIVQYCDHNEYAVCNLLSINLKKMVTTSKTYDHDLLHKMSKQGNRNLNRIIDVGTCPVRQAKKSNFRHRAVAAGVQALADAFILMGYPYESDEAQKLNNEIFETINHGSLESSCELAQKRYEKMVKVPLETRLILKDDSSFVDYYQNFLEDLQLKQRTDLTQAEQMFYESAKKDLEFRLQRANKIIEDYGLDKQLAEYQYIDMHNEQYLGAYSTFVGSPAYHGQLHYDLCGGKPTGRWDFDALKVKIKKYGLRNSLHNAIMPTATTSQLLGSQPSVEAINSNMYSRNVLAGSFLCVDRYLQRQLTELGLWNTEMKDRILMNNGSIAKIESIPQNIRDLFKTTWDMSKKRILDMAADREVWLDQSSSNNLFIADPDDNIMTSCHIHAWERGMKTGMYYLRRLKAANPQQFSIDMSKYQKQLKDKIEIDLEQHSSRANSNTELHTTRKQSNNDSGNDDDPCKSGACGT